MIPPRCDAGPAANLSAAVGCGGSTDSRPRSISHRPTNAATTISQLALRRAIRSDKGGQPRPCAPLARRRSSQVPPTAAAASTAAPTAISVVSGPTLPPTPVFT